jgi:arylsulfatase A-like enzyme
MKIFKIVLISLFFTPLLLRAQKPVNIIIIKTDQHRFDLLGCMGNKIIKTPNIDKLASQSFILTNEFTVSPICTPSRTSFFTGKYVIRTGDVFNYEEHHLQPLRHYPGRGGKHKKTSFPSFSYQSQHKQQ